MIHTDVLRCGCRLNSDSPRRWIHDTWRMAAKTSNDILQFSAQLKVRRLETITVFLRLYGRLPTSGLRTLEIQPCYNRTHTKSFKQIAVVVTEDMPSRQRYSVSSGSDGAKRSPVTRNGSNYLKQSAADSRQRIITELRGRPEDCLRHCDCYKIQNWQDFGKTEATDMGNGIGTTERQKSLQNRCIKNTSKIIRKK
jgi:hypothetical protein